MELLAARQAGAAGLERGAEVTLSSFPRHAGDRLCEPLMDWAVFIIDSPESKCLHIHKSSADSYSPSANRCARVAGMGGQARSSSPLQASSVANSVRVPVGVRICLPQVRGDIGAGDGAVRARHAQVWCQGMVRCTRCSGAEGIWGRIEFVSMGESRMGFVCKRASMWEKRRECLGLGVLGAHGAQGGLMVHHEKTRCISGTLEEDLVVGGRVCSKAFASVNSYARGLQGCAAPRHRDSSPFPLLRTPS